jgi:hypothetical protein
VIIGLSLANFTLLHVIISLVGIASGLIAVIALCYGRLLGGWTALFLLTSVATSVTGFMFPSTSFGPPQIVGVVSLIALAIAISALSVYHVAGPWRWIYVVSAVLSLYLNVFVGVAQSFDKIPALHPLAPTGTEPPFKLAQLIVLLLFIVLGIIAVKRFRPGVATRPVN